MDMPRRLWPLLPLLFWGCGPTPDTAVGPQYGDYPLRPARPLYHLAVHPLHNPEKLFASYQPLVDHLNRQIPDASFELEASRDYPAYEAKFRSREPELLLPNPWQTLEAIKVGYTVVATAGDDADFRGLLLVRRDGDIHEPSDLKGKVVSYPSPTALAACIMPQYFLRRQGVDVVRDLRNRYVGSQESSIMNVYLGAAAAGATWPPPWRQFQQQHPQEAAALKVAWETPPLVNNSVMVRNDVPQAIRERLLAVLLHLGDSETGRRILAAMDTDGFRPANDARYAVVREYVAAFERQVRPIEIEP